MTFKLKGKSAEQLLMQVSAEIVWKVYWFNVIFG